MSFVKDIYIPKYKLQMGVRKIDFQKVFERLEDKRRIYYTIIETGSIRHPDNMLGDGHSTILFDEFVNYHNGKVISIDIDPKACELTKKLTSDKTEVICGDSVNCLDKLWEINIKDCNLLYLDSFDADWENLHPSAFHHFMEIATIYAKLRSGCLIVVDDNIKGFGKGTYVHDFLRHLGNEKFVNDYLVGFEKS